MVAFDAKRARESGLVGVASSAVAARRDEVGRLRVGVTVPNFGALSLSPGVLALAETVEASGADSVWVPDHLCIPRSRAARYPYSPSGEFPFRADTPWMDCLTVLAAIAAVSTRVRLGTAVLVLTQRNPLEVAKVAASLDRISGGRLQLGLGAGWFEEEIRVLGYEPRNRGWRLDDAIGLLRECWTGELRVETGEEPAIEDGVVFLPTPSQARLPLIVGGTGPRALRRAAELGDGWIPGAAIDMLDFDKLGRDMAWIAEHRNASGPAGKPFEFVLVVDAEPHRARELPGVTRRAVELGFDEIVIEVPFEEPARAHEIIGAVREAASG
jgi:probable F420-dependent oxidoreductase